VTQFAQQLVNGTVLGATYGLIALGYTMVYGIIQLINFAHGEIFMVGAFGGLTVYRYWLPASLASNVWVALPAVLLVAVAVAVGVAVMMERLAYRPLRNAPRLAPLITAIGVSIFLQEAVRLFYPGGKRQQSFPRLISAGTVDVGGVTVAWVSIFVVVTAVAMMVALQVFV
jgi:branched-chain amino acid transport system permease protein